MPTTIGRLKKQVFDHIQDRIWKKLKGWKEKNLSFTGKSTLIQAVAQAILTYVMSCFYLPKNFCNYMEKIICNFWWGSNQDKNKMHCIKWSKLCKSKQQEGF